MEKRVQRTLARVRKMRGSGQKPQNKTFYISAKEAYEKTAPSQIDGFTLVYDGRTLDAYVDRDSKTVLIGVRGTVPTDWKDLKADASFPFNRLKSTRRYQENVVDMNQIVTEFPPEEYEYWVSGHSLGGGISTQLQRDYPFIQGSVDFNSAFQSWDLVHQNPKAKKFYIQSDPLYNLGGRFFKNTTVLPPKGDALPAKRQSFFRRIFTAPKRGLDGHSIVQFEGRV